jgi:hypothetical protein
MSTYTIYSDTSDGHIGSDDATSYADARDGTGTAVLHIDTGSASVRVGQAGGGLYFVDQSFLNFDTSGVVGTITAAVLSIVPQALTNGDHDFTIEARLKDWGATVDTGDFVSAAGLGSLTLLATLATSGMVVDTRYDFADVALAAAINQSGLTRIMLNSDRHRLGTSPPGNERISPYSGNDVGGAATQPRLVVTTRTPPHVPGPLMNGWQKFSTRAIAKCA